MGKAGLFPRGMPAPARRARFALQSVNRGAHCRGNPAGSLRSALTATHLVLGVRTGATRIPELFSVFFPSLSRDILWKVEAVSRVRFAAQKPRALDTAPTFQQILLRRKRREGVANRVPVAKKNS